MGSITTEATFRNPKLPANEQIVVEAFLDSGAPHLCIPLDLANQLGLESLKSRSVENADGSMHDVRYMGPIQLEVRGQECFTGALVFGNQILIGAVQMEDMELGNSIPENSTTPLSLATGVRDLDQ